MLRKNMNSLNIFRVIFASCLGFSIATILLITFLLLIGNNISFIVHSMRIDNFFTDPFVLSITLPLYSGIIYYVNIRFSKKTHILKG